MEERETVPLDRLPIEWIEDRVCEETFENRRTLREGGWRWKIVPPDPDTGMPSGLITVPDPVLEQASELARRADYLKDPRDPWSDYVDVREMSPHTVGVPYWIHKRADSWKAWNESTGLAIPPGHAGKGVVAKAHAGKEPYLPVRCKSTKKDGTRCWGWAVDKANEERCRSHAPGAALASNQGHNIMLAKVKIMQAMPAMADALEELATSAASEQVRLKAITEMMDRGGVNAATDINFGVNDSNGPSSAEIVRERLSDMARKAAESEILKAKLEEAMGPAPTPEATMGEDIVDAEIVSETEESSA